MNLLNQPPDWWTLSVEEAATTAAQRAYPNEVCGLFCQPANQLEVCLFVFSGSDSSPTTCFADPAQVVSLAYQLEGTLSRVVATFHSHPQGQKSFSLLDGKLLSQWSSLHVLFASTGDNEWEIIYGTSRA